MNNFNAIILIVVNFVAASAFAAPGAWTDKDDKFSLATEFDFNRYDSASTPGKRSIPAATGEYETGQWMFKVAVPYTRISGTAGTATGIGLAGTGIADRDMQSELGDPVAAASYNIYSGRTSKFGIDLTGKVKLKTADAGLDIGQNDYAAQADAYQSFDRFTAVGSVGLKFFGSPTGIDMNKVIYGSFGGSYQLDDKMFGGVDLNLSQNPSMSGEGHSELTAYLSRRIGKNFKAKGYILKGFSNGSPDNSLGAQVHYGF